MRAVHYRWPLQCYVSAKGWGNDFCNPVLADSQALARDKALSRSTRRHSSASVSVVSLHHVKTTSVTFPC